METEQPKRKDVRLKGYDYAKAGEYFITICTQNRRQILSDIVGEGSPLPRLTQNGIIADHWIRMIHTEYPFCHVNAYVIMPNHIHLILIISHDRGRGDPSPTIESIIGWLKYHITKDINQIHNTPGNKIFQRSFYDHIIRNRDDHIAVLNYIRRNPAQWQHDELFSKI